MSVNSSAKAKSRSNRHFGKGVALAVWVMLAFIIGVLLTAGIEQAVNLVYPLSDIKPVVLNTILDAVSYILALAVTIIVPWWLTKKRSIVTKKDLGLHRLPNWPDLLLGPVAIMPYLMLSTLFALAVKVVIPGFDVEQAQSTGFSNLVGQSELLLAFIILIIVAPIAEETLFRGYLYGKLRKQLGLVASIVLTSIAFATLHLPGANESGAFQWQWNVAVDVFALSIVLCLLREVTGSIWAGVLLHMTKNSIAFYLLFILPLMVH